MSPTETRWRLPGLHWTIAMNQRPLSEEAPKGLICSLVEDRWWKENASKKGNDRRRSCFTSHAQLWLCGLTGEAQCVSHCIIVPDACLPVYRLKLSDLALVFSCCGCRVLIPHACGTTQQGNLILRLAQDAIDCSSKLAAVFNLSQCDGTNPVERS